MVYEYYEYGLKTLPEEVKKLIQNNLVDEPFDWNHYRYGIVGRDNGKLIGIVAYGIAETKGYSYPRFLHIVIDEPHRRTRRGIQLMLESERYLFNKGYTQVITLILNSLNHRDMKRRYATKFGYIKYHEDSIGEYFYKNLNKGE